MTEQARTIVKNVVIFAVGLLTGGVTATLVAKKYYENISQEEIESVVKTFSKRSSDNDTKSETKTISDVYKPTKKDVVRYNSLTRELYNKPNLSSLVRDIEQEEIDEIARGLEDDIANRKKELSKRPRHEIIDDDFDNFDPADEDIFDEVDILWYRMNDKYVDEDETPIEEPDDYFGFEACGFLANTDVELVTVRNNKLEIIFHITSVNDYWQDPEVPDDWDEPTSLEFGSYIEESPRERMNRVNRHKKRILSEADEE